MPNIVDKPFFDDDISSKENSNSPLNDQRLDPLSPLKPGMLESVARPKDNALEPITRLVQRARPAMSLAMFTAGLATLVSIPSIALADLSNSATVNFGNPSAPGIDQNCIQRDEACGNAFHKMVPGAVTIDGPGTVTFQHIGRHQLAVYQPGTKPTDINIKELRPVTTNAPVIVTFSEAGKYLVICNIVGHWQDNMWGWVTVE